MDAKARWTPVGTYATLVAMLVAVGRGAAGVIYVPAHQSIPWSTIPAQAQRFTMGVDGVGLGVALVLVGLLFHAFSLIDVRPELRFPLHLGLVAVVVTGHIAVAASNSVIHARPATKMAMPM